MNTILSTSDYQVFDLMLEGIQVIDYDWRFTYANHTVTMQRTGEGGLIGRSITEVYPDIRHTQLFLSIQLCMVERKSQYLSYEMAYPGQAKCCYDFYIVPVEEGVFVLSRNKNGNNAAITHKVKWEYAFQSQERENRANELMKANREIVFQNQEKKNRADELLIANLELSFQQKEKDKRAEELIETIKELVDSENQLEEYVKCLTEMMYVISHKVRQPVANILGIAGQLDNHINSPGELKELIDYIKQSAMTLDTFTRELTSKMNDIGTKCGKANGTYVSIGKDKSIAK